MKVKIFVSIFVSYFVGFLIGILINILLKNHPNTLVQPTDDALRVRNDGNAMEEVKKIRILCFLNSRPATHGTRAVHIRETWGKHCDKLFFASTLTDVNLGAIGFNVSDDHDSMWGKEKLMLQFIYKHHLNDYDWFLKADDDTFSIIENLRYLLAAYSRDNPIYIGYKFKWESFKWGYFAGGSGYVMSQKTVRIFAEKVLKNREFFRGKGVKHSLCHIETDREIEDMHITVCLDPYNVYGGDGRDLLKRERFLMFWPEKHLFKDPNWKNRWYWKRKYYYNDEGLDCCSNYSIAFHYIKSRYQYTLYYLTYRLQPFGIERRFPPPPKKKIWSEVARVLDEEISNVKLRGF